jgi:hypothetical protein
MTLEFERTLYEQWVDARAALGERLARLNEERIQRPGVPPVDAGALRAELADLKRAADEAWDRYLAVALGPVVP